jgi:peptidyl-prolyl cis-trans isomerase A (cyclophilin A)/peptidyl-prolyl cis-trans isomerase B (cyclophilin B)
MRLLLIALFGLLGMQAPAATAAEPNPQVLIRTSAGEIRLELYPGESPHAVANFLEYADSGFYAGTIFHRVIPNFMVQAGGMNREMVEKPTRDPIPNESRNHLHNERGTVAMARTDDPDSATSQFFVNVRSNLRLDFDYVTRKPGYTVFGRVIDGMDVVDGISLVPTRTVANHDDVPENPVIIESIERAK